jgi:rSAM/selenodomain-associated transferase 2
LTIAGLGLLGRLFFMGYPVSNDVFRYIWEGYIQTHGFNPYVYAPDDPAFQSLREGSLAAIWEGINHKELTGVYPPLAMLLFRGLSEVSPTPLLFQGAMLACDLMIIIVLLLFIRMRDLPAGRLIFYAANPFILVYAIGEAHLDVIQAATITAGLYFLSRKYNLSGFLLLGAAIFSKYLAIAILPFVVCRSNIRALLAVAVPVLAFLPFSDDIGAIFHTLGIFGTTMHYNDSLAELARFLVGDFSVPLLVGLLLVCLTAIFLLEHDRLRSVYLAIGTILLFLPTLHPWYLIMIAPFMVIYPSRAWLYLMAAVIVTLPVVAVEYQSGVFQEIKILKLIEYVPFFCLLTYDFLCRRPFSKKEGKTYPQVETVSVVIPTLNEAEQIGQVFTMLKQHPAVSEVVIADGGSTDATIEIAQAAGALVTRSRPGRGYQINKGVLRSSGDVIIVLHADTVFEDGAVRRMIDQLNTLPTIPGGAFGMVFSSRSLKMQLISFLNNFRARWFGISFGDQGQFIRRAALENVGGFPQMMLMEDVELSLRLKKFGRPLYISGGARVSHRGWAKKSFTANVWLVLSLFFRYLIERRFLETGGNGEKYYRRYYAKSGNK